MTDPHGATATWAQIRFQLLADSKDGDPGREADAARALLALGGRDVEREDAFRTIEIEARKIDEADADTFGVHFGAEIYETPAGRRFLVRGESHSFWQVLVDPLISASEDVAARAAIAERAIAEAMMAKEE